MDKKLGFGFMRLPRLNADDETTVDFETTKEMVDLFMQAGFNYFDTAHRYHGEVSEVAIRAIRECLTSRYPRERYKLTNKLTTFHALNMANYREANQYHSFAFI